jgi:hypothetical protein
MTAIAAFSETDFWIYSITSGAVAGGARGSQDGLLREMLLSKYRLQIFDYIYIYDFKYF